MEHISDELLSRVLKELYAMLEESKAEKGSVFNGVGLYPASCIPEFERVNHCRVRSSGYDTLIINRLTCRDLGVMALGLFDDTEAEPAYSYLHGRDIYVIEEGIEYLGIEDMPEPIRARYDSYLQMIKDGGVRIGKKASFRCECAAGSTEKINGNTIDLTAKKLICKDDIPQNVSAIKVKKGIPFTPLAKDKVREEDIRVLEL